MDETALLERARGGDDAAFAELVAPYRSELHAHCYRLLASTHDADDALQDALVGAWRGIGGFEGRSSVRGWLYRIATHAAYRVGAKRPKRQLSARRLARVHRSARPRRAARRAGVGGALRRRSGPV